MRKGCNFPTEVNGTDSINMLASLWINRIGLKYHPAYRFKLKASQTILLKNQPPSKFSTHLVYSLYYVAIRNGIMCENGSLDDNLRGVSLAFSIYGFDGISKDYKASGLYLPSSQSSSGVSFCNAHFRKYVFL